MTFLCDTNIISELARPQPNPGVVQWSLGVTEIALSVITLEEITYGLRAKPNARIQDWFQGFLGTSCQILPITPEIAQRSGILRGSLRATGMTRTQADMLIAATAQVHQLTLVTRNTRDFEDCAVMILNPFTTAD
ncbi:MAG: type II toxin-antitoxin system VapC family toxin [Tildeniella torsiva UHER 1998/13D]|jgi:predicted nucleic acid-binding protein|nr:type II toxin-antitoxin system VapC family toxin [Tildeniella torsiva UHER 1998/13D]